MSNSQANELDSMPGGRPPAMDSDALRAYLYGRDDPAEPVTAPEIADHFNVSRRTALRYLDRLEEDGEIASKAAGGRSRVWWVPFGAINRRRREFEDAGAADPGPDPDAVVEPDPEPEPAITIEGASQGSRTTTSPSASGEWPADDPEPETEIPAVTDLDEDVVAAVDRIARNWDRDDRLEKRKLVAGLVLQHAVDSGDHVGKTDPVVEAIAEKHPVEGQDRETWWRRNIREVLKEVGTYSRGHHGYRVDRDDLEDGGGA